MMDSVVTDLGSFVSSHWVPFFFVFISAVGGFGLELTLNCTGQAFRTRNMSARASKSMKRAHEHMTSMRS